MLSSRRTYWLSINTSLSILIYILSVTTGCGIFAAEINIARIGPPLEHPWGLTSLDSQRVLVTTRPGSLYLINTSTQISKKITNTPKVVEYRQGGLLDVMSQKIGDEIIVFLCYSKPTSSSESSTAVFRATLDGDTLVNGSDIFVSNKPSKGGVHFGCRLAIKDNILYASVGDRGEEKQRAEPWKPLRNDNPSKFIPGQNTVLQIETGKRDLFNRSSKSARPGLMI